MTFRPSLFLKEIFLFGSTLLLGIFSAANYVPVSGRTGTVPSLSWGSVFFFVIIFTPFSLFLIKFKKAGAASLKFFLFLVVFSGSQVVFGSMFAVPWDMLLALFFVMIFIFARNVAVHDIAMVVGIAGVSGLLGMSITPFTAVILLVFLSFYDILAVYWTKHMVYLAKGMMESGAIFGFIIPFKLSDFFYHSGEAKNQLGERFMVLGSGDIGLPLVLAASVAVNSVGQALVVAFFALLGLFATHFIFVNQVTRKPMAALPPIATLTIIGYLISQLW